jgi:hypothetical protein
MLEWLKSVWAKWKIHITVVGGALVIATAYGTCTYEPASSEASSANTAPNEAETVPVNSSWIKSIKTRSDSLNEASTDNANESVNSVENTTATDNTANNEASNQ